MLNGAKKTTFDIARISIPEVTFQISNSDYFTSSNFFQQLSTQSRRFRQFFHLPLLQTPNPHTSPPFVTHTVDTKKNVFFMPLLHFTPPLQAQNYLYDFFSPLNEILHKLTSCHFTLQNKNVERFMPKNTSPFSLLRTKLYNS